MVGVVVVIDTSLSCVCIYKFISDVKISDVQIYVVIDFCNVNLFSK